MNKHIIIAMLAITTLGTACTKQDNGKVLCGPVEVPTYGFGSMITFNLQPTETCTYSMTFSNSHDYPIEFKVAFPDMPEHMQATIERNNFSLTNTKNYFNTVTLTTNNAKTGKYEVPVLVTTDKGGERTMMLQITVADSTVRMLNKEADNAFYSW